MKIATIQNSHKDQGFNSINWDYRNFSTFHRLDYFWKMSSVTSLWRPMSPESDVDVEGDDDDVTSCVASLRASQNCFRPIHCSKEMYDNCEDSENVDNVAENEQHSDFRDDLNNLRDRSEVPLDYSKSDVINDADDVTDKSHLIDGDQDNLKKPKPTRDLQNNIQNSFQNHNSSFGTNSNSSVTNIGATNPYGHMTNQNSDVTYPLTVGVPVSPFVPMTSYALPYMANYAAYMAMARFQLQEQQRRLLAWQQMNQRSRSQARSDEVQGEGRKESSRSPDSTTNTASSPNDNSTEISSTTTISPPALRQPMQSILPYDHRLLYPGHVSGIPPRPALNSALVSYGGRPRDPSKPPAVKKYKCDICEKSFSRSNTLVTHKRIHSGEKPFACNLCGRAFRQPGNLTRHRLTHTTVKPYVCMTCNKAFNRASNLHTHMRIHEQQKCFSCHYCNESFAQKMDLRIHMYSHQGGQPHH